MNPFARVFLLLIFFSSALPAQDNPVLKEYVIEIPSADPGKMISSFRMKLEKNNQFELVAYCESSKLMMVKASPAAFQKLCSIFKENNLEYSIKKNTTIKSASAACYSREEFEFVNQQEK